jgi:hypothetical protein
MNTYTSTQILTENCGKIIKEAKNETYLFYRFLDHDSMAVKPAAGYHESASDTFLV